MPMWPRSMHATRREARVENGLAQKSIGLMGCCCADISASATNNLVSLRCWPALRHGRSPRVRSTSAGRPKGATLAWPLPDCTQAAVDR
jgi:hypothetical protein